VLGIDRKITYICISKFDNNNNTVSEKLTNYLLLTTFTIPYYRSATMAKSTSSTPVYARSNGQKVAIATMNENHLRNVLLNYVNNGKPNGRKTTWTSSDGKRVSIASMNVGYLRNALASIVTPSGKIRTSTTSR
jgi:hypothetical protein